jgi:hypothetical protein
MARPIGRVQWRQLVEEVFPVKKLLIVSLVCPFQPRRGLLQAVGAPSSFPSRRLSMPPTAYRFNDYEDRFRRRPTG